MYQDFSRDVRLASPPAAVWNALLDFERVASWLTIVGSVRELEPHRRYSAVLEDRVGPFRLRADLGVTVDSNAEERRMHVAASGEDRQVASRITAAVDLLVADDAAGTALSVKGRYEISGRVATLGAGAIRQKGDKVLDQFFANLTRGLSA